MLLPLVTQVAKRVNTSAALLVSPAILPVWPVLCTEAAGPTVTKTYVWAAPQVDICSNPPAMQLVQAGITPAATPAPLACRCVWPAALPLPVSPASLPFLSSRASACPPVPQSTSQWLTHPSTPTVYPAPPTVSSAATQSLAPLARLASTSAEPPAFQPARVLCCPTTSINAWAAPVWPAAVIASTAPVAVLGWRCTWTSVWAPVPAATILWVECVRRAWPIATPVLLPLTAPFADFPMCFQSPTPPILPVWRCVPLTQ